MADWALGRDWPDRSFNFFHQFNPYQLLDMSQPPHQSQAQPYDPSQLPMFPPPNLPPASMQPPANAPPPGPKQMQLPGTSHVQRKCVVPMPKPDNPREVRNKAEKQRRDKLNQSIAELAAMVPPVVAASRKIDKTGVLRLTAHFLRSHQYVFGETIGRTSNDLNSASAQAVLQLLNGFLLTITYKGIVVVVSQNVQEYLGYTELDLLGQNILTITHKDDHKTLREHLMPRSQTLGANGELIIPDLPAGKLLVAAALAGEKRRFIVRFKKQTQRAEPVQYISCQLEGSLRKSDRACRGNNRCCQMVRRARARGDNPCSSGNDVVFIGIVRPTVETFKKEYELEHFRMEYRTRHSIDGQIIECDKRISMVTGYMTDEVNGVNAMNFMHRDDVRWVIIALREMYDQHRLYGESCYRLMMKNGQFIYMRTRGCLEVDKGSKEVTSFVCTNTMLNPDEGEHLIKLMKKKFTMLVNNNEDSPQEPEVTDTNDDSLPVEDPRQLEKVILHLVTNLPSPQPEETDSTEFAASHLAIIPPRKERIVMGIEKIYTVIKSFKNPYIDHQRDIIRKRTNTAPRIQELESTQVLAKQTGALPKISTIGKYRQYRREDVGPIKSDSFDLNTPNTFADYIAKQPNKQSKFNFTQPDDDCVIIDLEEPGTSADVIGTKRPIDYQLDDELFKKKIIRSDNEPTEQMNGRNSPTLEKFFNEAILDSQFSQIDAALISLENTIDPAFPDLLISQDVQDILSELEYDPDRSADEQVEPN